MHLDDCAAKLSSTVVGVPVKPIKRLTAWSCHLRMLVEEVQEGQYIPDPLACKYPQVPGAQFVRGYDWSFGLFPQDLGRLSRSAQIRTVDRFYRISRKSRLP
jgi:hypothetical protein